MALHYKIIFLCVMCGYTSNSRAARLPADSSHRLLQNNEYLPPAYTAKRYGMQNYYTSPQLNSKGMQSYKPLTSYAPPASGAASYQYSAPQVSNEIPLSTIIPKALLDEKLTARPVEDTKRQQQVESKTLTPVLVTEEPAPFVLTPNNNRTVEAAKLLAATLLDTSEDMTLRDQLEGVQTFNSMLEPNQLNTTDVVIVKAQKNAYIVPQKLAMESRNPVTAQALYEMREQLTKAYTINQFIFIIKPEKINFLNKLI